MSGSSVTKDSKPSKAADVAVISQKTDETCPICRDHEDDGPYTTTPCGHSFHTECIKSWLPLGKPEPHCPMCRGSLACRYCQRPLNDSHFTPGGILSQAVFGDPCAVCCPPLITNAKASYECVVEHMRTIMIGTFTNLRSALAISPPASFVDATTTPGRPISMDEIVLQRRTKTAADSLIEIYRLSKKADRNPMAFMSEVFNWHRTQDQPFCPLVMASLSVCCLLVRRAPELEERRQTMTSEGFSLVSTEILSTAFIQLAFGDAERYLRRSGHSDAEIDNIMATDGPMKPPASEPSYRPRYIQTDDGILYKDETGRTDYLRDSLEIRYQDFNLQEFDDESVSGSDSEFDSEYEDDGSHEQETDAVNAARNATHSTRILNLGPDDPADNATADENDDPYDLVSLLFGGGEYLDDRGEPLHVTLLVPMRLLNRTVRQRWRAYIEGLVPRQLVNSHLRGWALGVFVRLCEAGYFDCEARPEVAELRRSRCYHTLGDIVYDPDNEATTLFVREELANMDSYDRWIIWNDAETLGVPQSIWKGDGEEVEARLREEFAAAMKPWTDDGQSPFDFIEHLERW